MVNFPDGYNEKFCIVCGSEYSAPNDNTIYEDTGMEVQRDNISVTQQAQTSAATLIIILVIIVVIALTGVYYRYQKNQAEEDVKKEEEDMKKNEAKMQEDFKMIRQETLD